MTRNRQTRPGELQSQINKLAAERTRIDRDLASLRKQADSARPWLDCLRCGHRWQGLWLDRPPRYCARCHSAGWNIPAKLPNSRKPSDPPNPNWDRKRKPKPALVDPVPQLDTPPIGNVPGVPAGAPRIQDYAESHPLPPMKPLEMTAERYLGLPPIGLPPPPILSTGLPSLPQIEEPQGESSARPAAPAPEPEPAPVAEEKKGCDECAQEGVELIPCTYGCGEILCSDCLGEHQRTCESREEALDADPDPEPSA